MTNLVGKKLKNRYRIEEFLGRGGMAEVYKVWDTQRGVALAMKVLREDLAEDIVFMRRFEREAHNLTKLQHPNIVRCYGLEQEGRTAFMLMDYIEGGTLRSEIFDAHGPLALQRILEIMQPVCSALSYAHQMGMVHCDVKSANIMIHKNGTVYLTDFGIARGMDAATSTMVGVGTPAYMAPELIKGDDPTPQTDIYALGIVLYEMLTGGERPFTGERATITGTTAEKVRWEHIKLDPIPISHFNPNISIQLEEIFQKAIQKEPGYRYSSVMDFLGSVQKAIPRGSSSQLTHAAPKYTEEPAKQTYQYPGESTASKKMNPGILVGGIAAFLIFLIAIISSGGNSSSNNSSSQNSHSSNTSSSATKPTIQFWADENSIDKGDCTYLNWEVDNADAVYLDGTRVSDSDYESICPRDTTTYTLIVQGEDGKQYSKSLTVNIYQQASTKPTSTSTSKTCIGYGNDEGINIRKSANGLIIGCCLGTGMKVTIYEVDSTGKWGRIKSEKGHEGWVSLQYINISGTCDLLD
ncbi:MAG: protein kinase [Anaerolineaceae bacterium]